MEDTNANVDVESL